MMLCIAYVVIGYLSGSILFARVFARLLNKGDIFSESKDQNPGVANAFMYGGFWCGSFTLCGELLKGFLPVYLYRKCGIAMDMHWLSFALVFAAPVLGHIVPLYYQFHGGKGIAVTFGCLIGIFPNWFPLAILATFFIFFSLVLRISPHFYRTIVAYFCTFVAMVCLHVELAISVGFLFATLFVFLRLHKSQEEREKCKVNLLWIS